MFEKFKISVLFDWQNGNTDLKKKHINGKGYPVVSSGVENMGIIGYTNVDARILPAHTITIDMFGNVYYRDFEYKEVTHARVFTLIPKNFFLDCETGLYLVTVLQKITSMFSYNNMCSYAKISNMFIELPIIENSDFDHEYTVDDIDWDYMRDRITELERDRITELERDRITELDAYLQATGLNDYELTEDDKKILSFSAKRASDEDGILEDDSEDEVKIAPFELTELFTKRTIKGVPKKDEDLTENPNGYHIFGQNIKYQYEHKVLMDEKYLQTVEAHKPILAYTSSVGEIGMITESFYRTGNNGAFQGLFPLFGINEYAMRYILTVLQKHFADFGYATSMANIMSMKIYLPIKSDGTPDFDYMERYIRAIEKVVIADVVKYKDKVIEETRKVVGEC